MKRLIFSLFIILSFFLLPWYICAILMLAGIFLFDDYYESLVMSIVFFAVYFPSSLFLSPVIYSVGVVIVFFGLNFIKRFIILYQK